jgi:hypothetical protein
LAEGKVQQMKDQDLQNVVLAVIHFLQDEAENSLSTDDQVHRKQEALLFAVLMHNIETLENKLDALVRTN